MSDPLFHQLYESYHLQILIVTNEMQLHQLHDSYELHHSTGLPFDSFAHKF